MDMKNVEVEFWDKDSGMGIGQKDHLSNEKSHVAHLHVPHLGVARVGVPHGDISPFQLTFLLFKVLFDPKLHNFGD